MTNVAQNWIEMIRHTPLGYGILREALAACQDHEERQVSAPGMATKARGETPNGERERHRRAHALRCGDHWIWPSRLHRCDLCGARKLAHRGVPGGAARRPVDDYERRRELSRL